MWIINIKISGNGYIGFLESHSSYYSFSYSQNKGIRFESEYPKTDYKDYSDFIEVLMELKPNTSFIKNPIAISSLSEEELSRAYEIVKGSGVS